jgi:hypothetical protein
MAGLVIGLVGIKREGKRRGGKEEGGGRSKKRGVAAGGWLVAKSRRAGIPQLLTSERCLLSTE